MPEKRKRQSGSVASRPAARTKARTRPAKVRHENLGRLLIESFRFFRERTRVNLRAHGFHDLNPVHAAMLRRVDEGGTHISDIAARMGVTKQAAAQLVAKAEALGYVKTGWDKVDTRKKMVRCTALGKRFLRSLDKVVADSVRDVATLIGAKRLRELEATLRVIAGRLPASIEDEGE
jgi:DNA-binding MarR family transcriptional regulator